MPKKAESKKGKKFLQVVISTYALTIHTFVVLPDPAVNYH